MSLYQGYAQQKGFDPVNIPDPSDKIRKRGLEQLKWMQEEVEWKEKQSDRFVNALEKNNEYERAQRQQNYEDATHYADIVAKQKWRNFETAINSAKANQKNKQQGFKELLQFTKLGTQAYKAWDAKNKEAIDNFADDISRDYGIGLEAYNAIRDQDDLLKNGTVDQAFLLDLGLDPNTPLDVLQRIRGGGSYMKLAVTKLSARAWMDGLPAVVADRANDPITLPGYDNPLTLNLAEGPTKQAVLNQIIREERAKVKDQFSNKVLQLIGANGPSGSFARLKAHYTRIDTEESIKYGEKYKHKETSAIIRDFIGPQQGTASNAGGKGFIAATYYFAGGKDATGKRLSAARKRVVGAAIDMLNNDEITWDEVKDWGKTEIEHRGHKGKVEWKNAFPTEWAELQKAGRAWEKTQDANLELRNATAKLAGKEFHENMKNYTSSGNFNIKTVQKFLAYGRDKGTYYEAGVQHLQRELALHKTNINDKIGADALLAKAAENKIITQDDIDRWNFSEKVLPQIQAKVKEHNRYLPNKDYTDRLEKRFDAKLKTIIEPKNNWQVNETHEDALKGAIEEASGHFKDAKELNKTDQQAYEYALSKMETAIQQDSGRWERKYKDGKAYFSDFGAKTIELVTIDHATWGKELHENRNLLYSKTYIPNTDLKALSGKANQGYMPPIHKTAQVIEALTKGTVPAVDVMQAQLQRVIDEETEATGSSNTQLLPKEYIARYKKEDQKLSPLGKRLLNSYNLVDVPVKGYISNGYQPANQSSYYSKANKMVETGDFNAVRMPGDTVVNSKHVNKYNITALSVREVLQVIENGHIKNAGNALFDYEGLKEAVEQSGIGYEAKFNADNQRKLQQVRYKKYGLAGFPHVEPTPLDISMDKDLMEYMNTEKIKPETYFRSKATCNTKACAWLEENYPAIYGANYGE